MTTLIRATSVVLLFSFAAVVSNAQTDSDVRVEIDLASDTARGGERFSFTAKITNAGTKEATDVIMLADDSYNGDVHFEITSAISQKGECELSGEQTYRMWRCRLGTLAAGETVTANFAGKLADYDGDPEGQLPSDPLGQISSSERAAPAAQSASIQTYPKLSIATVSASPAESEKDEENNHASVYVQLMPSSNRPPKVSVVSPNNDAPLTRSAKKSTSFEFKIEASDPDGSIEKVVVYDPKGVTLPVPGADGRWNFVYLGKTYTAEELDSFMKSNPPPELLARRTGKNTFVYKLTDPPWGRNILTVTAFDNGGRTDTANMDFFVKGDATIEIVSPKKDQIITPGSTVVIETLSRVNEGPLNEVSLFDSDLQHTAGGKLPQFQLVSKQGNVYRHRYVLKNVQASDFSRGVKAILIEASGAITESSVVSFLPRNVSKISFTSITNRQVFTNAKVIEIRFDVADSYSNDKYSLYIDGHFRNSVHRGFIWHHPEPGPHTIQVVAEFSEVAVGRSELVTIYVK